MSFSFWLLVVGVRDLSQADKETTSCKAEQIHKMATTSRSIEIVPRGGPPL